MSFEARYPGTCLDCEDTIGVGDQIEARFSQVARDSKVVGYAHAVCPDTDPMRFDPDQVCPECFTVKAVNGACACL